MIIKLLTWHDYDILNTFFRELDCDAFHPDIQFTPPSPPIRLHTASRESCKALPSFSHLPRKVSWGYNTNTLFNRKSVRTSNNYLNKYFGKCPSLYGFMCGYKYHSGWGSVVCMTSPQGSWWNTNRPSCHRGVRCYNKIDWTATGKWLTTSYSCRMTLDHLFTHILETFGKVSCPALLIRCPLKALLQRHWLVLQSCMKAYTVMS